MTVGKSRNVDCHDVRMLQGCVNDAVQVHQHVDLMEDTLDQLDQISVPVSQEKDTVTDISVKIEQVSH